MARPVKQGLDYFPKLVDFYNDYKIMDLLEKHGPVGVTVYEIVLCEVFRNGYYLAASIDKLSANVVRIIGSKWVQKRLVSQVILDCGELGLFETTLLMHGVITSVGIQRRYAIVTARNKVKKEEYWLIDEDGQPLLNAPKTHVSVTKIPITVTETKETIAVIPQKESKEKKTKQNKTYSSEPETGPRTDVAYQLNLIDGTHHLVYPEEIEKYQKLYPAVDVNQEYRNMIGWLDANPKNRKTKQGIDKFINGWHRRTQDSARPAPPAVAPAKKNSFHNFPQRETDYDAMMLERLHEKMEGGKK